MWKNIIVGVEITSSGVVITHGTGKFKARFQNLNTHIHSYIYGSYTTYIYLLHMYICLVYAYISFN